MNDQPRAARAADTPSAPASRLESAMQILFKPNLPHHRLWRNAAIAVFALLLLVFVIRSAAF